MTLPFAGFPAETFEAFGGYLIKALASIRRSCDRTGTCKRKGQRTLAREGRMPLSSFNKAALVLERAAAIQIIRHGGRRPCTYRINPEHLWITPPKPKSKINDLATEPSALAEQRQSLKDKLESLPADSESVAAREDQKVENRESFERPTGALQVPWRFSSAARIAAWSDPQTNAPAQDNPAGARGGDTGSVQPSPDKRDNKPPHLSDQPCPRCGCRPALNARIGPRSPTKLPALKAKIKEQLRQKLARFLAARKRNEQLAEYWTVMLGDDPVLAQKLFDATDRRMRAECWDDMRDWRPTWISGRGPLENLTA